MGCPQSEICDPKNGFVEIPNFGPRVVDWVVTEARKQLLGSDFVTGRAARAIVSDCSPNGRPSLLWDYFRLARDPGPNHRGDWNWSHSHFTVIAYLGPYD